MSDPVGMKLYHTARHGDIAEFSSLLRDHTDVNVNWANYSWTSLHIVSIRGNTEVVKLLLAHPNISVNLRSIDGKTSFLFACWLGHMSVVQELLKDPRVDVTLYDFNTRTPLWYASYERKHEVIEWLIASGRDLGDIKNKKGKRLGWWQRLHSP